MSTTIDVDDPSTNLATALGKVASSKDATGHLYEILGTFCHQTRNILNCLKMSLYLARRGSGQGGESLWDDVDTRYLVAEHAFERLQLLCRPMPLSPVLLPLSLLFEDKKSDWQRTLEGRGRSLVLVPPVADPVGLFDPIRLGQGFDDIVLWRSRAGVPGSDLRLAWYADGPDFHVTWDEPVQEKRKGQTEVEVPSECQHDTESFVSLTIPFLTRIVTLHGGSLVASRSGPWRLDMRWPLDARTNSREAP